MHTDGKAQNSFISGFTTMGQRMTRRQVDEGLELYAQKDYDAAIKKWTTALQKLKDDRLRFATLGYLVSASRDSGRYKDYLDVVDSF